MDEAERLFAVSPDPAQAAQEGGSVRKAREEERTQVARALARAFYSDLCPPGSSATTPAAWNSSRRVFGFLGSRVWFPHDLTYTTEHVAGAAVWIPPGQWRVGVVDQLRMMAGLVSSVGLRDLPRALRGFNLMESKHPRDRHYYLPVVGVEPQWQGKGIGTALLQPVRPRGRRGLSGSHRTEEPRLLPAGRLRDG